MAIDFGKFGVAESLVRPEPLRTACPEWMTSRTATAVGERCRPRTIPLRNAECRIVYLSLPMSARFN